MRPFLRFSTRYIFIWFKIDHWEKFLDRSTKDGSLVGVIRRNTHIKPDCVQVSMTLCE